MSTTTNYGLIKPGTDDPILVGQLNDIEHAAVGGLRGHVVIRIVVQTVLVQGGLLRAGGLVAEAHRRNIIRFFCYPDLAPVSTVADIGTVKIADDVVAMIAAFAALDVEGVASLPGDVTREEISKGGMKKIAKSVRVDVTREGVKAELSIIVEYGFNIPTTSSRVQKRVKNAIEEMTGLAVIDVDIHIAGISIPD